MSFTSVFVSSKEVQWTCPWMGLSGISRSTVVPLSLLRDSWDVQVSQPGQHIASVAFCFTWMEVHFPLAKKKKITSQIETKNKKTKYTK